MPELKLGPTVLVLELKLGPTYEASFVPRPSVRRPKL